MTDSNNKQSDAKYLQFLIENINNKINNSSVLNGGFDKMMIIVEHIKEKQEETSEKVNKIHEDLYKPEEGLYARVQFIESQTTIFGENYKEHIGSDEENLNKINSNLTELKNKNLEDEKKLEIANKLKKIAGDDLEKLNEIVNNNNRISTNFGKIIWILIPLLLGFICKIIFDKISGH